jgi:hypothetical protein
VEHKSENEKLIIRYLLGDLPEEESVRIEDRYFADDDFFEELAIVEEELISDYEHGKLTGHERERFKDKYLSSPTRRNRVEFSRNLMNALSIERGSTKPDRSESRSWLRTLLTSRNRSLQFALSAAALLFLAVTSLLVIEYFRARNEINRLQSERATLEQREKEMAEQAEQQRAHNGELLARLEREQNDRQKLEQELAGLQPQAIKEFDLFSNALRGDSATKSFTIPNRTKTVRLKLYLEPDSYKSYRATIQNAKGEKAWSKSGLQARKTSSGKELVVGLPAELFSSGDYTLTLGGATAKGDYEDVSDYDFKVVKK